MKWRLEKIGDFCRTGSGGTPSRKKMSQYYSGAIPWVKSGELRELIITSTEESITDIALKETSAKLIPSGALLVAMYGATIGRIAILGIEAASNQAVCHIIPDLNIADQRYLFHALRQQVSGWLEQSVGGAQPNINQQIIKETKIPLPPLEEQERIAAILDKADRIRRKRQEAIRLTEELGRSIFLDMFGDPVTNPKGWEIKKLKSVIRSIDAGWSANGEEKKCEEDEWGVLKVSAVTSGKFKPFEHKSVGKNPNFSKSPIIPKKGDLLFSRANTRELVAATCIVEQNYERIFLSDKLWRISVLENMITPEYLKFLLTYQRYRDLLTKQATGTSGSMLNISQGKLLDMDAPIPDINTQRKFSDLIWKSIKVSTWMQENRKESENLFNSLLQRAFRGEL
jgi:type I restriction enzyme, S subunit